MNRPHGRPFAQEGNAPRGIGARIIRAISLMLIAGGIALLAFIDGSDLYAQWQAESHISQFSAVFDDSADPARLECLRQAQLYNEQLAGSGVHDGVAPYARQLFYRHEPMMSYLEIPKIAVKLPIYHGTGDEELMAGVGHWEESSLPVGGRSAHCVLMAHSGMRNARMFDDLRKLEAGDRFTIWTLNDPYCYEVLDAKTVEPDAAPALLRIEDGRDLVTLVTCTPYGVNSHRLLVRAERCPYDGERMHDVGMEAYVNDRNLPFMAALALVAACAAAGLATRVVREVHAHRMRPWDMRSDGYA
ncbi:MAG: class C sortase [Coriobacteriaceae bacterium]|nr:class C sortase [Coriobacteriaceae bacterium]